MAKKPPSDSNHNGILRILGEYIESNERRWSRNDRLRKEFMEENERRWEDNEQRWQENARRWDSADKNFAALMQGIAEIKDMLRKRGA